MIEIPVLFSTYKRWVSEWFQKAVNLRSDIHFKMDIHSLLSTSVYFNPSFIPHYGSTFAPVPGPTFWYSCVFRGFIEVVDSKSHCIYTGDCAILSLYFSSSNGKRIWLKLKIVIDNHQNRMVSLPLQDRPNATLNWHAQWCLEWRL